jgi:UDP-glucose 4-epimerase
LLNAEGKHVNALITGGAGFIGSNLARALVAEGNEVRILDDLSTGSLDNLRGVDSIAISQADVLDLERVREVATGADVIFHLAALPSVQRSIRDPLGVTRANVEGTVNVLLAARDRGVRRVVYASSSSVYGDTPVLPKHEDMAVSPRSPYAASKLSGEVYCRAFTRSFELATVSLRFFNVFGPRQDPESEYAAVIPRFLKLMLAGQPPEVFGDGLQSRDFTYVDNAVRACLLAASAGPDAAGEAFNVACGNRITLLELVADLNDALGTEYEPVFAPPRPGDVRHSLAAIEKAERLLGYRPMVDVRQGLAETSRWFADEVLPTSVRD